LLAKLPGDTSPSKPGQQQFFGGSHKFDRDYFLTGFTWDKVVDDSWEYTFADSTWLTDRYYVRFEYYLGARFGVRAPFGVDVSAHGNEVRSRDVEIGVEVIDVDDEGKPAYPAVGLPESKTYEGHEFLLGVKATCKLHVSIPGPNKTWDCPSIDENYDRDIDPVLGSQSSQIKDWWLTGSKTGLKLDFAVAHASLDLGVGADVTNGRVGVRATPLSGATLSGLNTNRLYFTNGNKLSFKVNRSNKTSDTGFKLDDPRYRFDLRLRPKARIVVGVDLWVYEKDWTIGPYALDALSFSVSHELGHHAGTVSSHTYKVFKYTSGQVLAPTDPAPKPSPTPTPFPTPKKKLPPAGGTAKIQ
jgi:hypothetical protein